MTRPKLQFARTCVRRRGEQATSSDYRIYATYVCTASGAFMGGLKVVRMTDGRVLFPYDGAPEIGPFPDPSEAREAAMVKGNALVSADLASPE
jgi:hypothetical protein